MERVTLRLVMEWAGLGLRSQHRVRRYRSNPNSDTINSAAGIDPRIPRLYTERKNESECERKRVNGEKKVLITKRGKKKKHSIGRCTMHIR